jgi:dihydrofolate reductase
MTIGLVSQNKVLDEKLKHERIHRGVRFPPSLKKKPPLQGVFFFKKNIYYYKKNNMISLIVAKSKNNIIGNKGKIPWHIPNDLKRFKNLTTDNVVIMGRKTYESLPEEYKPLPNRMNIIISRDKSYSVNNCLVFNKIEKALRKAGTDKEIFIIGGGEIYKEGIKYADKIYVTEVDGDFTGDTYFPELTEQWKEINREEKEGYRFIDLIYNP